ncbi:collagen alpha-1(I) chain [Orussus abietinus]|uniref:collagen alpha-1(I) chain n=1 Tax=Orussus abietinus TaxID=222816 RepID=UPI0006250EFC|nr:collagen alpha-1(I) chain [Orussus abietinus]
MSVQAEQAAAGGGPDTRHGHHPHGHHHSHHHHPNPHAATASLFRAPVRVNPDSQDRTTQQIQSKLGNYSLVKHLLDEPKRLIGIEGVPASPAPASASASLRSSGGSGAAPRIPSAAPAPAAGLGPAGPQEFKKPGGPRSGGHGGSQRGGFVKPADGKPPYGGRGGYPGQPVKHGGGSNEHRSHGLLPAKGPPPNVAPPTGAGNLGNPGNPGNPTNPTNPTNLGNTGSRVHSAGGRLPRIPLDNGSNTRHGPTESPAELENILKEMMMPPTPLTAIAQTPRKELESKFTFNPVLAKLTEVPPAESAKPRKYRTSSSAALP